MPDIFISYRRADSAAMCDRINDYLVTRFTEAAVFRDVDSMPKTVDFREHIKAVIGQCAVVLVIIGPRWLSIADNIGNRRLLLDDDPVRMEIELALKLKMNIFPVLVEGARMPQANALPWSIRKLADRNGSEIRYDPDFKDDMKLSTNALDLIIQSIPLDQRPTALFARGELRETSEERWPDLVELRTQSDSDALPPEQPELTAYYPLDVAIGRPERMLVYIHSRRSLNAVRTDAATQFHTSDYIRTRYYFQDTSQLKVGRTVSLQFTGNEIAFRPSSVESILADDGKPIEAQFVLPPSRNGMAAVGEIAAMIDGQPVANIKLPILISGLLQPQDNTQPAPSTQPVYRRIFLSYSRQDSEIARVLQTTYQALGIESLIDVDFLRAGESIEATVERLIQSADVFQLLWSRNASASYQVRREWQYALSLGRGDGFIRPVFWEMPMPTPPPELAQVHFAFADLVRT